MADKKSKKSKKHTSPRLKKVARAIPARKKVAKKKIARKRSRDEWIISRLVEEERDLWRAVCVAASINGEPGDGIESADRAVKAFRERYRTPEVIEAYVARRF